jgi:hypothetical protein
MPAVPIKNREQYIKAIERTRSVVRTRARAPSLEDPLSTPKATFLVRLAPPLGGFVFSLTGCEADASNTTLGKTPLHF